MTHIRPSAVCSLGLLLLITQTASAFLNPAPALKWGLGPLQSGYHLQKSCIPPLRTNALTVSMSAQESSGRREFNRLVFSSVAASIGAASFPDPASALCGAKPASWEFWINWEEALMPVGSSTDGQATTQAGRNVFYRIVGDSKNEKTKVDGKEVRLHPLLVIPDKLKAHDYLEPLEAVVTSDRRVVFYDPLGTGYSDKLPPDLSKRVAEDEQAALDLAVKELSELVTALKDNMKVDQFHLLGHGFGASVALAYAAQAESKGSISSVSLAEPAGGRNPSPELKTLKLSDPTNLCTKQASDIDREVFVKLVISFMDETDGLVKS